MIGAGGRRDVCFVFVTDRGNYGCTSKLRKLDRIVANSSSAAGYENGLLLYISVTIYAAMRRQCGYPETSTFGKRDFVRQWNCPSSGHYDIFGCGTKGLLPLSLIYPDPFARTIRRYTVPDAVDDARPIEVRDDAWCSPLTATAGTPLDVNRVDAGCHHLHPDLSRACLWRFDLSGLKDIAGIATFRVPDRFHSMLLSTGKDGQLLYR